MRKNVGMTGEITLRGQVLPIGGVKEKVLAANRFGLTTVILPKRNEGDLDDLPDNVRKKMNFVFVERVEEVIEAALTDGKAESTVPQNGQEEASAAETPAAEVPQEPVEAQSSL